MRALCVAMLMTGPAVAQNSLRRPIELLPANPAPFTSTAPVPSFTPAPVPDRDAALPIGPRAPKPSTELTPGLFGRREQFRGDGFMSGSTAQSEQEKRTRPAAGFNFRMPLQPTPPQPQMPRQ